MFSGLIRKIHCSGFKYLETYNCFSYPDSDCLLFFQGVSEFKSADLKHALTDCQCSLLRYDEAGSSWKPDPYYNSYNLHSSYPGAVAYVKTERGFYRIPKPSPSATYAVLLGE